MSSGTLDPLGQSVRKLVCALKARLQVLDEEDGEAGASTCPETIALVSLCGILEDFSTDGALSPEERLEEAERLLAHVMETIQELEEKKLQEARRLKARKEDLQEALEQDTEDRALCIYSSRYG